MPWVFLLLLVANIFAQTKPLMMEHADSLSVERSRGFLLLKGNVRFRHDSVQFRTERATWNKNQESVHCEGGFLFLHPKGSLKANSGDYRRKEERADALGDVVARDSSGDGAYFGARAIYDKKNEFLDLIASPILHRYVRDTVKKTVDTMKIEARRITYSRKTEMAVAYGRVRMTRGDLVVTCDTGWFDQKNGKLALVGRPTCNLKENRLTGDSMFIVLDGDKLKTVRVIRNALGTQDEKPKNGDPIKHTRVQGDTLFAEFDGDKMKRIFVSVGALGEFWEEDLKKYVNKMSGNSLALAFQDGLMQDARVLGSAKSTYWYTDKNRVISGRNEAVGDTIFVGFDSSKVKRLRVNGNLANGVFYDLSKGKNKIKADSLSKATPDSTKRAMPAFLRPRKQPANLGGEEKK